MNIPPSYTANLHTLNKTRPQTTTYTDLVKIMCDGSGRANSLPLGTCTFRNTQNYSNSETWPFGSRHAQIFTKIKDMTNVPQPDKSD